MTNESVKSDETYPAIAPERAGECGGATGARRRTGARLGCGVPITVYSIEPVMKLRARPARAQGRALSPADRAAILINYSDAAIN
ncbi:hypothetical protein EVAR_88601_1 [Eumeta japonica]|uniref:Uncharacterized protein n=1 Tax=Eumeta variegata TaxID=151549 RepID=A0A4C2A719_EUMVA|nr:hypothetical protein EVAR_88601_1 [Eumeta japonica]